MRKIIMTLALSTLVLVTFAGMASAQASRTYIEVVSLRGPILDPGKSWIDEDGVRHNRGVIGTSSVFVDVDGSLDGPYEWVGSNNNNWHPAGYGDFHGTFELPLTVKGVSGVFSGHYDGTSSGFVDDGHLQGKGSGGFAGMKIQGTWTQTWSSSMAVGSWVILDPKGNL